MKTYEEMVRSAAFYLHEEAEGMATASARAGYISAIATMFDRKFWDVHCDVAEAARK